MQITQNHNPNTRAVFADGQTLPVVRWQVDDEAMTRAPMVETEDHGIVLAETLPGFLKVIG